MCVMYLEPGKRVSRLESGFKEPGCYVGIKEGATLPYVGVEGKILECRAVRSFPEGFRGDAALVESIRVSPWQLDPADVRAAPERVVSIYAGVVPVVAPVDLAGAPEPSVPEVLPRGVYLSTDIEVAKYRHTPGCLGCTAAILGQKPVLHSDLC